ncbi:hypothetical protein [Devosia epidermidihirudinis]|nr:hypothetical protein [Devosia epidermidihirudinis]
MMKQIALLALCGLALTGSAMAQDERVIDQSKLYVSELDACEAIERRGAEAWMESDFISLSFSGGLQGTEYQCHFVDVKAVSKRSLIFVSAVCELPGEIYPDTLAIAAYDDKTIQVVSSYETAMAAAGKVDPSAHSADGMLFTRCDNLSETYFD